MKLLVSFAVISAMSAGLARSAHAQPSAQPAPAAAPAAPGPSASAASPDPGPSTPAATPDPAAPDQPAPPGSPPPLAADPGAPALPLTPGLPAVDPATIDRLVDARIHARLTSQLPPAGWKDSFFIASDDGASLLKVGGIIQFDGRWFVENAADPKVDQFAFRSIRPDLHGTLFDHYDFRILPDFAGGKLVVQEAYTDVRYSDAAVVRFGKFKVPFGLERLQSEVNTAFVERGLPTQIAPNRDLGVQVFGLIGHGTLEYEVGAFNGVADGQSGDGDVSNDKEIAARVFIRPFAIAGGRWLKNLGVGGATTYGDKAGTVTSPDVALFKTEGQNTFFTYKVGTTVMDTALADGLHWRATGQGYYYGGPFGLLAEYVVSKQKVALNTTLKTVTINTWSVTGQWVLTGDNASYDGVAPSHAFDPAKGHWGAVTLAARICALDVPGADVYPRLADPTKSAHKASSVTGGLDWIPNRAFRFMLDVDHISYDRGAKGDTDKPAETSIIGRVQTAF